MQDDIFHNIYPLASNACGKDNVFGLRRISVTNSINRYTYSARVQLAMLSKF